MDSKPQSQPSTTNDQGPSSTQDVPPPPTYAQALKGVPPIPHRQLSLPGDEPSHPTHHICPVHQQAGVGYPNTVQSGAIYPAQGGAAADAGGGDGWTPPSSDAVGKARARRRFFVAFLWAMGIYLLVGMLLGGGIEDARQDRNRHRGLHGSDPSYPPFGESTESEIVRGTRTWKRLPKQTEVVGLRVD